MPKGKSRAFCHRLASIPVMRKVNPALSVKEAGALGSGAPGPARGKASPYDALFSV